LQEHEIDQITKRQKCAALITDYDHYSNIQKFHFDSVGGLNRFLS